MEPQRHNLFNLVHKGLRLALFDTATRFQKADFGNRAEMKAVILQLENVIALFERHAWFENNFITEPLSHKDFAIADMFEKEHDEDEKLGEILMEQIQQWKDATTPEARKLRGQSLFYAFNEFIAFNLNHMVKEETALNRSLWMHFTDAEIKALVRTMLTTVGPEKTRAYNPWMIKAASNPELAEWFNEIHAGAQAEVFESLCALAEEILPSSQMEILNNMIPSRKPVSIL